MKQEYSIELIEEHDNVNFYSIKMKDEELTELEVIFEKFCIADASIALPSLLPF